MKSYTIKEHTADLCVEFYGNSQNDLFQSTGSALFDILYEAQHISLKVEFAVTAEGFDTEDLLIAWLRELLYIGEVNNILLCEFIIDELSETKLKARVRGEPYNPEKHSIRREIKAATYHDLKITEEDGKWKAVVVFDL